MDDGEQRQPQGTDAPPAWAPTSRMRANPSLNQSTRQGRATEDELFLKRATHTPEANAFVHSDPWRVLRIMGEFVHGFDTLAEIGKAVTIFGSARVSEDDPMYQEARRLGALLLSLIHI